MRTKDAEVLKNAMESLGFRAIVLESAGGSMPDARHRGPAMVEVRSLRTGQTLATISASGQARIEQSDEPAFTREGKDWRVRLAVALAERLKK